MSNPFSPAQLWALADQFGTPLWVYDAATIRQRIAQVSNFDTVRFAQKACSNIHILKLMREQGVKVDAVSRGEILRALAAGYVAGKGVEGPSEIVFTADLFDAATLDCVVEHGVPVNAGSIDMLHQLGARSPGHAVWLRINPGFGHGHSNKTNTGGEHSKHGIWHTDLPLALQTIREQGLTLAGLHMHIGSGVDYGHLAEVCGAMVELVRTAHAAGHGEQDHALTRTGQQPSGEQFEVGCDDDVGVFHVELRAGELLFVVGKFAGELNRVGLLRASERRRGDRDDLGGQERLLHESRNQLRGEAAGGGGRAIRRSWRRV